MPAATGRAEVGACGRGRPRGGSHDPANLPRNRRPPAANGGTGKDPVWEIDTDDLGPDLRYVQDKPAHGVVGPGQPMTLAELEQALAATRARWVRVIG